MNESKRTLIFVGVAAACVGVALLTHYVTRPAPLEEFADVGEPFYPEFQNPNDAQGLQVIAFDENTASIKEFQVVFKDGLWRIPSHHNYPADAQDRLANTAASVIGIERGTLVGRRDSDHERFGVIDPLDEAVTSLKGRGHRITLTQANGKVLADYIIGKKYEPPTPTRDSKPMYYVRLPKGKEVYLTQLDIDLSTKFSDWIKADLLDIQREDLREIVINNYSIDEAQRTVVDREVNRLTREKSFDPWKLEGLNEAEEEVEADEVRKAVSTLDELKIVGVRPKPEGVTADLKVDQNIVKSQLQLDLLIDNLASKGFPILPGDDGKPQLIADEGELVAATDKGIVYTLRFGAVFTGSEFEIETGLGSDGKEKAEGPAAGDQPAEAEKPADAAGGEADAAAAADGAAEDKTSTADQPEKKDVQRNRYLFVSAAFDPKYLGLKPVKPEEPQQPAAEPAESSDNGSAEGDAATDAESTDDASANTDGQNPTDGEAEQPAADANAAETDAPSEAAKAAAEYEAARKKYEGDLQKYETDLKAHDQKIKDGEKQAKELNDRFAGWYYVISAENFESLRLSRDALVKPKEKKEGEAGAAGDPAGSTETSSDAPAGESAAETQPEAETEPAAPPGTEAAASESAAPQSAPETKSPGEPADPAATPESPPSEESPGEEPSTPPDAGSP